MVPVTTRSLALLRSVVDGGELTRDEVAGHLGYTAAEWELCVAGTQVMSLAHQLVLAALVIDRVPRLRRRAHALRAQAVAAAAFKSGATAIHSGPPSPWRGVRGQ